MGIIDIFPERPKEAPEHKIDGRDNLVAEEASLGQEPRGHRSNGVLGKSCSENRMNGTRGGGARLTTNASSPGKFATYRMTWTNDDEDEKSKKENGRGIRPGFGRMREYWCGLFGLISSVLI